MISNTIRTVHLKHITSPYNAVAIAMLGKFLSFHHPNHYDCGMNFLGALGEYPNTAPESMGATLLCSWTGPVSSPLPPDFPSRNTPNILHDFNGSGKHFINNDPRYLLPYGSFGLVLNEIIFDNQDDIINIWLDEQQWPINALCKIGFTKKWQLNSARDFVQKLNEKCRSGMVIIKVCRGFPQ